MLLRPCRECERGATLLLVLDAQHDKPRMVGIDHPPVRAGEPAVGPGRDVAQRDRVVDIAADDVERARTQRDDDVAMPGEVGGREVVKGDRPAAAPVTPKANAKSSASACCGMSAVRSQNCCTGSMVIRRSSIMRPFPPTARRWLSPDASRRSTSTTWTART